MKSNPSIKSWLLVTLVAAFVSACATTQEEMSAGGDGAPFDQSQSGSSGIVDGGSSGGGAEASGLDGADGGDGTAIVDTAPMTAMELLEANRRCTG